MGNFDPSSRTAFVKSHTDVGQEGLALSPFVHCGVVAELGAQF